MTPTEVTAYHRWQHWSRKNAITKAAGAAHVEAMTDESLAWAEYQRALEDCKKANDANA